MNDLEMDLLIAQVRINRLEKELADKKPTVEEAIAAIKAHCKSRPSCTGCHFDENGTCFFMICNLPCDWDGDSIG